MPLYPWACKDCDHEVEEFFSMAEKPDTIKCGECGGHMSVHCGKLGVAAGTFQPYVEDNFTGEPILVTSPKHRDRLCEKFHKTYDQASGAGGSAREDSRHKWEDDDIEGEVDRLLKEQAAQSPR